MGTKSLNHYEILGLWRDASEAEIRRAYRHLARFHHPDVSSEPDAAERFQAIQEAYDVLSDPAARASFDATLSILNNPARSRPTTKRGSKVRSDRHPRADRSARETGEQTKPKESKQIQEAPAEKGLTPTSPRAVATAMRRSWKTIAGPLLVLGIGTAACVTIYRTIRIGTEIGTGTGFGAAVALTLSVQIAFAFLRSLARRGRRQ